MKKQVTIAVFAAASAVNVTPSADAYVTFARWSDNNITMRASSVSFANSAWRTSLQRTIDIFYQNPSQQWFSLQTGDTSVGFRNRQNEIWFSASAEYSPAVTIWRRNWLTGRLREADIIFYNGTPYTTSMSKTALNAYGGSRRPFQTTAMHELGHAAGLGHEADEYNIMGEDYTHVSLNGSTCRSYVGEDGCDGLVSLYGRASGTFEDVSVVHMRRTGQYGAYSLHGFCRMFNRFGGVLSSTMVEGQPRYNVTRGRVYQTEFTWENNGETTQSANIAFYISTNNYISTGDRRIATGHITVGRDNVNTLRVGITIPPDLARGRTYYLGTIVDYDNRIVEVTNANNSAYHIIRVKPEFEE